MSEMLYINTAPARATRQDGTHFWTVLVGIPKAILAGLGHDAPTKTQYTVREQDVEKFTRAFEVAREQGFRLVVRGEKVVVTTPRANTWTDKTGAVRNDTQSSAWVEGEPVLDVVRNTVGIGDALAALLG